MRTTTARTTTATRAARGSNAPGTTIPPSISPATPATEVPQPRAAQQPAGRPARAAGARVRETGLRLRGRAGRWLNDSFRLPDRRVPAPHPARLVGVCVWAAVLGLLGLPVAARASIAIISGAAPGWFEPTVVVSGLTGIGLTVAAFTAIHRARLSWLLLAAATVPLLANLTLTLKIASI